MVEQEYQIEDPFLTHSPEEAYGKGKVDLLPWICGQAEDEGYSFLICKTLLNSEPKYLMELIRLFNN